MTESTGHSGSPMTTTELRLVAVHDVERDHPPVASVRAADLERVPARRSAASAAVMLVMSGWTSLLPPNGTGGCPGAKSISE